MFLVRRKMDPKLISQQWENFLKVQVSQLSNQVSSDEDQLINNPYYSKYAEKLKLNSSKINQQKTDLNLSEEERRMKEKFIELERKLTKKDPTDANVSTDSSKKQSKIRKLDDVMKLELIQNLDKEEIKKIWYEYFKMKDGRVFACLDAKNYDLINQNAIKYPTFVFLLPVNGETDDRKASSGSKQEKSNYQFVLVQFQTNQSTQSLHVHFTPLAFFHTHKENAPATLTLNYYTDLKQKDLVLMEGEYDEKIFNLLEAQCLANQIQLFYVDQTKQSLLDKFTNNSNSFDHMVLIEEFEKSLQI